MTSQSTNTAPFLPASIVLPKDPDELLIRLTLYLNDISYRLNTREIGWYEFIELTTGQSWFSDQTQNTITPNIRRSAFRKVFSIPNIIMGANSVPHNLGDISTFTFTDMRGTMNMGFIPFFCPIPQSSPPDDIALSVDATNVTVTTFSGVYTGGTAIVVLEYLKN